MRKNLFIILMVCLAVVGLVSCKNEIEPAQEELVYVSFENGTSRALTATLETFNPNNYWWSYEAQKNDGSGLLSGETAWNETGSGALPVQSGQGLDVSANNPVQVPGFSKGYWNFRLFAYKNSARTQLAYWGEADAVRIDNTHHTASVTVSPVAGDSGYLKVGTITFNPASAISGPTDLVVFEDTVSLKVGDGWKAIKWDEVPPYYMDGEDKHILPAAGYAYDSTTDTYTLPSGQYLFTRTYSYEGISVASGSVLATVYSNLTTTVSGSISELTSYAQFEAIQNPDAVNVSAEATGIKYDDLTKTSGYDLTDSENKVTAKISKTSVDKIMESIQVNAGTESGMDISDTTNTSMALSLGVDTTAQTATSVVYEISMTATITYTKNPGTSEAETKQTTADVSNVDDYVTAVIKMQKGLESVVVKHDGKDMTSGAEWAEKAGKELTVENFVAYAGTESNPNAYGYYYYVDGTTDSTLYIKTKSFSPFTVSYKVPPKSVALTGGKLYSTLEGSIGAIANATDGATITLLADVELTEQIIVSKALTIDTNGNALTGYNNIVGKYDVDGDAYDFFKDDSGMDSETNKGVLVIRTCEAKIGSVFKKTITDAVSEATNDDVIIIPNNVQIVYSGYHITVPAGKSLTIDLNGHSIEAFCSSGGTAAFIRNQGTLKLKDSSDGKTGSMTVVAEPTWKWSGIDGDYVGSYATNLIRNEGTLIVENGTYANNAKGSACYAIDNYSAGKVTINGGKLTTSSSSAIRLFYNSGQASLTIKDGVIGGENSYMSVQDMNSSSVVVSLSGGEFNGQYAYYACGTGCNTTISGGVYNGFVGFGAAVPAEKVSVTNGTFNAWCGSWAEGIKFISGGTFTEDPTDYVVEGAFVTKNADGTWSVFPNVVKKAMDEGLTVSGFGIEDFNPSYSSVTKLGMAYADGTYDGDSTVYRYYEDGKVYIRSVSAYTGTSYVFRENVSGIRGWNNDTISEITITGELEMSEKMFQDNTSLTTVHFTKDATKIPARMFYKANGLVTVTIPNTVTTIETGAFQQCANLEELVLPEGLTYIPDSFVYECTKLTSMNIPSTVTSIAAHGIRNVGLESVTIPAGVSTIGSMAFRDCEKLTTIIVEIASAEGLSIASDAFQNVAPSYPSTKMRVMKKDVCTYISTLSLSSASHITIEQGWAEQN